MKNIEDFYPLSPMQQGILFHSLYAPSSGVYCELFSCNIQGELNTAIFKKSWQKLIERHPILRTSFVWEGLKEPAQVVHKQVILPWEEKDWRKMTSSLQKERIQAFLVTEQQRGFDIYQAPLMRLTLIQLNDNNYQFIWSHHHLLLDGWSSSLLLNEVFTSYKAFNHLEDLHLKSPRPYRDYIAWLQQHDLSQSEAFWRQRLHSFTAATSFTVDQPSSHTVSKENEEKNYRQQHLQLSKAETAALQSLARQLHLTLNTLVLGAWAILLSRYSGENDVVFGSVVSGRGDLAGTESMVGVLINTLPMRVCTNSEESLVSWLKQLQVQQNEIKLYEQCPLIKIQNWSDIPAGQPLFESIVNFQNYPIDFSQAQQVANLKILNIRSFIQPHYPLTVSVKVDSELLLEIFYTSSRFEADTIARMLGHFRTLLLGMTTNQQQRLRDLPLLTAQEHHQLLVDWNNTQVNFPQQCIHQLFEAQVQQTPLAVAVVFENQQLTYQELNCRANQLAHYLRNLGVGPEVLVGICVERSPDMVIGLLGILKAGGAYIPLDPSYPQERLAFILQETQAPVLLTQAQLVETMPQHEAKVVCLDADWQTIAQQSQENLFSELTTDNLAYVIYTSGSTGKPKGVQIPHSALSNFLCAMRQTPGLTKEDILLAVTTISFDIAALELFLPITVGACLVVVSREIASDGMRLWEKLALSNATVMQATPATWQLLLAAGWQGNHQLKILCGGEALPKKLANQLLDRCASLWNMYGPTETTIWSAASQIKTDSRVIPISHPISNTQFYILDQHSQLVPVGAVGELHISGSGLARGYLNRPELTAENFIPNPFSNKPGARLYKTGDLARYLPSGEIEYIGRIDRQVKIRGFRIELAEIEAVISQHPAVRETVVVVRSDSVDSQRLVAYIVCKPEQTLVISQLRDFIESKLPSYMAPTAYVILEALPLTPNGKIDPQALPTPDLTQVLSSSHIIPPSTPIENLLAGIWAEVLGIDKVGIDNNFFELGGHSLIATRVISQIRQVFQVELPLRCLFEKPTIAVLAKEIEKAIKANLGVETANIERVSRLQKLPLSFAQQRLWFIHQLNPDSALYNSTNAVLLKGLLNIAALQQSINEIVHRHEVLRTTFSTIDGQPFQVINPSLTINLPVVDLCELTQNQKEIEVKRLTIEESQYQFDLTKEPLLRCTLIRTDEQEHTVLFTIHHIISDGWSMGVFISELAALYKAFSTGKSSPLPELPIQYADFAVWQRRMLQTEALQTQLNYWKQQLGNNLPVLQLPTVRPRAEVKTNRNATQTFVIPSHLSQALQALSRQEGVTLFMTLLAGFQVLLQRHTNQDDIVVGTDIANRNRTELEPLIGFFVNLLVLRTYLGGNPSFRELLQRVRSCTLGAYAHQDLPFDQLVKTLQPERNFSNTAPLFQVLFVLQNAPMPTLELPELTLNILEVENRVARFDLALFLTETEQGIIGKWQYNADLFAADTLARMTDNLQTLLNSIVTQPNIPISALEIHTESERQKQAMQTRERKSFKREKFISLTPKALDLSQEKLIKTNYLLPDQPFPLVIQPNVEDIDLVDWAQHNREFIERELLKHGAILFRAFSVESVSKFENVAQAICPELFGEYGDLPRAGEGGKVYGSTPYPSNKPILFHNESSHLHRFPLKIWFFCVKDAEQGGETPIVDCRKAYQLLNANLRERLAEKQLMYVRHFTDGLDVSWQDFFQTNDKKVVENFCYQAKISYEWYNNNELVTRQIRPALAIHPKTNEPVFFNQIQLHHIAYLDTEVRDSLLSMFNENKLPRNVYYGNGTRIEDSVIAEINEVYRQSKISFPWQKADILMLDNMLAAHGRNPYIGERKIVVAMGEMIDSSNLENKSTEKADAK